MNRDKLEEGMVNLLEGIVSSQRKKSKELVKGTIKSINESEINLENPEDFYTMFVSKLNRGVKEIATTIHEAPVNGIKDTNKPNFIYMNYDFLKSNIEQLCMLKENNGCNTDKSRFIINMYFEYSLTNEIPQFKPEEEHYFIPKFGTFEEWIALCDGLYALYYGKNDKYIEAYHILLKSEIRRYKHILHNWFIEFKDGELIEMYYTWDKHTENPYDNEFYDKGNYYVFPNDKIKHRLYEEYKEDDDEDDFSILPWVKVPKTDIVKIFKKSEERMV